MGYKKDFLRRTLTFTAFLSLSLFVYNALSMPVVHASACAISTNNVHDYAGLVVHTEYKNDAGTLVDATGHGMYIAVDTNLPTSTAQGNVVRIDSYGNVAERLLNYSFYPILDGNCASGSITSAVILRGDGRSGSPSTSNGSTNWALDCDYSLHNSYFQSFTVSGHGTPSGARSGGYWSPAVSTAPPNGTYYQVTMRYTQPAPPPDWSLTGSSVVNKSTALVGDSVSFTHTVKNSGPNTATTISTQIHVVYPSSTGAATAVSTSIVVGRPYVIMRTITIPAGATAGQRFCQYITFSDASGPSTTSSRSSQVCVVVGAAPQQPPPQQQPPPPGLSGNEIDIYGNQLGFNDFVGVYTDASQSSTAQSTTSNPYSFSFSKGTKTYFIADQSVYNHGNYVYVGYQLNGGSTQGGNGTYLTLYDNTNYTLRFVYQYDACLDIAGIQSTNPSDHYPTDASGNCPWIPPTLNGEKINENTGPSGYTPYMGNSVAVSNNTGTTINSTTANPYSFLVNSGNVGSGNYYLSQAAASSPDGTWVVRGFTFCDATATPTCDTNYVTNSANIGSVSNPVTMYANHTYLMRWFYEYIDMCSPSRTILSPSAAEDGIAFPSSIYMNFQDITSAPNPGTDQLSLTIGGNTYTYSYNINNAYPNYTLTSSTVNVTLPYGNQNGSVILQGPNVPNQNNIISCARTISVGRRPYFKVYGADIFAGGTFKKNGICNTAQVGVTRGNLFGNYNPSFGGAGSELAALAIIKVSGLASADLRTTPPTQASGLTFANSNLPPPFTINATTFGGYSNLTTSSSLGYCAPDYFTDGQFDAGNTTKVTHTPNGNPVNVYMGLLDGKQLVKLVPGHGQVQLTASGGGSFGKRSTLFVDGDVFIKDNILYGTSWNTIASIPYLTVVVRGNIYISSNVNEIDGVYIAQPITGPTGNITTADSGRIYTCRDIPNGNPISVTAAVAQCSGQLTIRGALIAQRVVLQRTFGTLKNASLNEVRTSSNISEVVNFTPEFYVSKPVFKTNPNKPDTIKSLPPTL